MEIILKDGSYQGASNGRGQYNLYVPNGNGELIGPIHTNDMAKITWEVKVQKREVTAQVTPNGHGLEITSLRSSEPFNSLVEDVELRLGILREKLKKLLP